MEIEYALLREKSKQLKYRLWRRSSEVIQAIQTYGEWPKRILDLGTADGRMMQAVRNHFPKTFCVGIDMAFPLLEYGKRLAGSSNIHLIQADVQDLSFIRSGTFDTIIAAAVIEHLDFPLALLVESLRILKERGLMILTTPHPRWEKIADSLHLIKGEHKSVMGMRKLRALAVSAGFLVVEEKGFMISPIGFPGEIAVEKFLRRIRLGRHLPNQLMVLDKGGSF